MRLLALALPALALPALALVALIAAPAHAQADVLCGSLEKIIAAANEKPLPFTSVGADFTADSGVAGIGEIPPGLQSAERCDAHMPASSGFFGAAAGDYWEFACTLYSATGAGNLEARAESELHRDNMVKRARACLAPGGWANAPGSFPARELHLAKPGSGVTVHVTHAVSGSSRREQSYTAMLSIRLAGGPKPPAPSASQPASPLPTSSLRRLD